MEPVFSHIKQALSYDPEGRYLNDSNNSMLQVTLHTGEHNEITEMELQ